MNILDSIPDRVGARVPGVSVIGYPGPGPAEPSPAGVAPPGFRGRNPRAPFAGLIAFYDSPVAERPKVFRPMVTPERLVTGRMSD